LFANKAGNPKHLQVFRDGRPIQGELSGDLARSARPFTQQVEDLPPHRVGDGTEDVCDWHASHYVGIFRRVKGDVCLRLNASLGRGAALAPVSAE
jgi:hypothetical protein